MRATRAIVIGLLAFASGAHAATRVFVAGDSTASAYPAERRPRTGWGEVLGTFFDDSVEVVNRATSGRSTRSWIDEGRLDAIAAELARGDVLLIQFGHNDEKQDDPARYTDPRSAFRDNLRRMVAVARQGGAEPVLVTPVARRRFAEGDVVDSHGAWSTAVRDVARAERVILVDLDARSRDLLRALGDGPSRAYYLYDDASGLADDTHFSPRGATAMACLVVDELARAGSPLAAHRVRDTDCGAPPDAVARRAAAPNDSRIEHESTRAAEQPGPHGGPGTTTGYTLFADAPGLGFVFRKRVLHAGAGIGLHFHDHDEIYYVVSGRGRYTLDGRDTEVGPGHALLTRVGSTHGMQQVGDEDLVLIITYPPAPAGR
ncbi:MAG TPA: GDSL-type esterase/lipase family protein [Xanthomonadales bacterium]|nr:GDSL-type esterase/lipase family protein [Xanthomonadales bacterium]